MSAEDLENYETEAQMALYREYKDVNVEERLPNQEFTVPEMPDFSA